MKIVLVLLERKETNEMKVLGIFAHPDDELLWGFPMMQYDDVDRYLITVSDNHTGYAMQATKSLRKVCEMARIKLVTCMGLPSEYYRIATRRQPTTLMLDVVPAIKSQIKRAIADVRPDRIITHNPFGEYGHGDHRLLFNIVSMLPETDGVEIVFTDACQLNKTHLSFENIPRRIRDAYYKNCIEHYTLCMDWFVPLQTIYQNFGAWSWTGHEVVKEIGLYKI